MPKLELSTGVALDYELAGSAYPLAQGDIETFVSADFLWVASPTFLEERPDEVTAIELDWMVPTRYGLEVQSQIAGSRLHLLEGPHSSHMAFIELKDEFNAITRSFLDEQPEI